MQHITSVTAWIVARLNVRSDRGATAIEYAVVASAIAAMVVLAVALLGRATSSGFDCTQESWSDVAERC